MAGLPSEFEEKEYEAPLYNQLESGTRLVWSPGQVFEQYIGIDRAMFLSDPGLWQIFGAARPPVGVFLDRMEFEFLWRRRPRRTLPNFRLNLFIQAKRSFFHKAVPRLIRGQLAKASCWRFDLNVDQQNALGLIGQRLGNRAIVCYAAPAFHRVTQLNAHTSRGTIVKESTFPLAERLMGHTKFYYSEPGGTGVANPPEPVAGRSLDEMLIHATESLETAAPETQTNQLAGLANDIERAIGELPDSSPRKSVFVQRRATFLAVLQNYPAPGLSAGAFLRVAAFASAFNVDWYVVGRSA